MTGRKLSAEEIVRGIRQLDNLTDLQKVAEAVKARVSGIADELVQAVRQ